MRHFEWYSNNVDFFNPIWRKFLAPKIQIRLIVEFWWVFGQKGLFGIVIVYLVFALQLSTAPGDSEAIDVWFVMLDRPNLYLRSSAQKIYAGSSAQGSASRLSNRPRLISISEAYRNLAQLISQRDIPLKLPLNKDREVIARLRKHSLQVAPESVYPSR